MCEPWIHHPDFVFPAGNVSIHSYYHWSLVRSVSFHLRGCWFIVDSAGDFPWIQNSNNTFSVFWTHLFEQINEHQQAAVKRSTKIKNSNLLHWKYSFNASFFDMRYVALLNPIFTSFDIWKSSSLVKGADLSPSNFTFFNTASLNVKSFSLRICDLGDYLFTF